MAAKASRRQHRASHTHTSIHIVHYLPPLGSLLVDGVSVSWVLGGVKAEQGAEERLLPSHGRHGVVQALLQSGHLPAVPNTKESSTTTSNDQAAS